MKLVKCDKCAAVVEAKLTNTFRLYRGPVVLRAMDLCQKCIGVDSVRYNAPIPKTNAETIMDLLIEELAERGVQMEE